MVSAPDRHFIFRLATFLAVLALLTSGFTFIASSPAHATVVTEAEPNNSPATATPLALSDTVQGSSLGQISCYFNYGSHNCDDDYYSFTVASTSKLGLSLTWNQILGVSGTDTAYRVEILDANLQSRFAYDTTNNDFTGTWAQNRAVYLPAGTYYAKISGRDDRAVWGKPYNLTLTATPGTFEQEFNDSTATATPLTLGTTMQGSSLGQISCYFNYGSHNCDDDYYSFTLPSSTAVSLNANWAQNSGSAQGDPAYQLSMFNASTQSLFDETLNNGNFDGSQLRSAPIFLAAGTYFFKVSSRDDRAVWGKPYKLSIGLVLSTSTPTISGTAKVGSRLTAKTGAWTGGTTFKYQWKRDGKNISGATATTYKLTTADIGRSITVTVTGSKANYAAVARTSAAKTVPTTFTDVPVTYTHFTGIEWMALKGYVSSGPNTPRYFPTNPTTRGAFATMLMRMSGESYTPPANLTLPYTDVAKDNPHYKGIAWMYEKGYAASASRYNPQSQVTRGAMATFMQRMEDPDYHASGTPFADVHPGDTHYRGIAWMRAKGYAAPATNYNPAGSTTRGAMATFLYRIYG